MTDSQKSAAALPERRVYKPHKASIPNLRQYFGELWRRRDFAFELAHTNLRATNTNTVLGQLWLVVNPLLLAGVYFLLVVVLSRGSASHSFPDIAAGLFLFFYVTGTMQACVNAVTNAGSLVLNMSFPKMLLILSNVYVGLRRFLPTLIVYFVIHIAWGLPWSWTMLWMLVAILLSTFLGLGLGALVATWQVYFRDTAQFLPYFVRIWLYASPVLYSAEMFLNGPIGQYVGQWVQLNPVFGILGIWHDALGGQAPEASYFIGGAVWALALAVIGTLYFVSREREFAVRL